MNYFYINTQTLEYPLYEGDIRLVYENIGNIFELPTDGVYARVDMASISDIDDKTQVAIWGEPVNTNGVWTQPVTIRDLTEEELIEKRELFEKTTRRKYDLVEA